MTDAHLVLDAATYRGTVAVVSRAAILAEGEAAMRGATEERLMPAVAGALDQCGLRPGDIGGVICGAGPGSFTSLRIAASIAKAFALSAAVPLRSVSSLMLIVAGQPNAADPGRYLAVLDAMRDELFAARVDVDGRGMVTSVGEPELVNRAAADRLADSEARSIVGPACARAWSPHARGVARLAQAVADLPLADLASWEPSYGRLAEAQVKWEQAHGRSLSA